MKLAGKTDVGSVRPENQDDYRAGELNSDAAWGLVCDGMGGARGGREASVSACDVIEHSFHEQYAQCLPGDEEKFLKRRSRAPTASSSRKPPGRRNWRAWAPRRSAPSCGAATPLSATQATPGPTSSGTVSSPSSPTTLLRAGAGGRGTITAEEAEHHPQKNIITRALGVDYRLDPEFTSVPVQKGDMILLCTDGLTNVLPKEKIEEIFTKGGFYDIPDRLVDAANAGGGPDNITALLLGVEPLEVKHG